MSEPNRTASLAWITAALFGIGVFILWLVKDESPATRRSMGAIGGTLIGLASLIVAGGIIRWWVRINRKR